MYLALTEWFENLEKLKGQQFNFDHIGERSIQYSLMIPTNMPDVSTDVVGNEKKVLNFILVGVLPHSRTDIMNNIDNVQWFADLKKDVKELNKQKELPDFGEGMEVHRVIFTTDGYIEGEQSGEGRYQIQGRVEYTEIYKPIAGKLPDRW